MTRLITYAVTVREADGYTADEAADDIEAAFSLAGIDLVEIKLRTVQSDTQPARLAIAEDRTPDQLAADGDACLCPSPEVIAYECPVHAAAHPGRQAQT